MCLLTNCWLSMHCSSYYSLIIISVDTAWVCVWFDSWTVYSNEVFGRGQVNWNEGEKKQVREHKSFVYKSLPIIDDDDYNNSREKIMSKSRKVCSALQEFSLLAMGPKHTSHIRTRHPTTHLLTSQPALRALRDNRGLDVCRRFHGNALVGVSRAGVGAMANTSVSTLPPRRTPRFYGHSSGQPPMALWNT